MCDEAALGGRWESDLGIERFKEGYGIRDAPPTPPNVGILTGEPSGIIVVDVDPLNGGDETVLDLEHKHGALPDTVQSMTGTGWHFYFSCPNGLSVPGAVLGPGVDLKANRGYVVAPGSLHQSGRRYEWEVCYHPEDMALTALPEWIVTKGHKPRSPFRQGRVYRRRPDADIEEFGALWGKAGIVVDPEVESHYLCPFHGERNPSLHIDPQRCVWHCFGCGAGGGLFDLRARMSLQPVRKNQVPPIKTQSDIEPWLGFVDPTTWPVAELPDAACGWYRGGFSERLAPTHHRVFSPFCRGWDCGRCGPYLKKEWLTHLDRCFWETQGSLHVFISHDDEWKTTAKAIERQPEGHNDFVSFSYDSASSPLVTATKFVITTAEFGLEVTRDQARTWAYHALMALPFDVLRISTSTPWDKKEKKPPNTGRWRRVIGYVSSTMDESAEAAKRLRFWPSSRFVVKSDDQVCLEAFDFYIPDDILKSPLYPWMLQVLAAGIPLAGPAAGKSLPSGSLTR